MIAVQVKHEGTNDPTICFKHCERCDNSFVEPFGVIYLNHEILATFAKALQHAQEEMRRLHQVFEVGLRLLGFIVLSQQGQENLPVLHHVEYVAWETL